MPSRREQKQLRALRQRRNREEEGLFLAEGVRAVEDLAASPLSIRMALFASPLEDGERGRALLQALAAKGVAVQEVPGAELRGYAGTETPQGIVAMAEIPRRTLADLRPQTEPGAIVVLDAVQDPGNFGTLVRTAEALGAAGVVSLPGTVDAWNAKAVRSAMGSSFRLPLVDAAWDDLEPWLRGEGFAILAAAAGGESVDVRRSARTALVLGNEGAGVSAETLRRADGSVGIPLRGRAESLNVAAAGAILLYELLR
jgi:RNA methyltransferase, TrmH family